MQPIYPAAPGFKKAGPSEEAAPTVSEASTLRQMSLSVLERGDRTADEIAESLGRSVLAIRPRITELKLLGRITETAERRRNSSGKMATVWRAA